jgi:hypothetical protein
MTSRKRNLIFFSSSANIRKFKSPISIQ